MNCIAEPSNEEKFNELIDNLSDEVDCIDKFLVVYGQILRSCPSEQMNETMRATIQHLGDSGILDGYLGDNDEQIK